MTSDFEIGRVVGVNTAQISVELNQTLGGMNKRTFEGIQEVGLIGSYVIVPRDALRLVGIVTSVAYEEKNSKSESDIIMLSPQAKQILRAVLIGTIDDSKFTQGVQVFPVLNSSVHLSSQIDLNIIFGTKSQNGSIVPQGTKYTIPIGKSSIFSDRPVLIDPDAFFGKHAAILGSTGSGKSCTIASIIQSILEQPNVNRTTFIVLDTNGEYSTAFTNENSISSLNENVRENCLHISTDPQDGDNRLIIPYWFMNSEDFIRIFQASSATQAPVLLEALRSARNSNSDNYNERTADSPAYFKKLDFESKHIKSALEKSDSGYARAKDYISTMLLRMNRFFVDKRYEFLFGRSNNDWPNAEHVLAAFIRDIIGLGSQKKSEFTLSSSAALPAGNFPFYDRQRHDTKGNNVIIVDLSLLAVEVLESVTALIGRLILEFLQRLGEDNNGTLRGKLPVVLILEEAQNYINQYRSTEGDSISRLVYEQIAREGRKYGLGLVVASQRPSELSKTVLSQCSSFIVHRLQNPDDLNYFKQIVPSVYDTMLNQLPALAPQTALVLGECVAAPMLVKIRDADPIPLCEDPKFYTYWTSDTPPNIPVEEICAIWEGKQIDDPIANPAESQE